jgi:hypothetical protein
MLQVRVKEQAPPSFHFIINFSGKNDIVFGKTWQVKSCSETDTNVNKMCANTGEFMGIEV